MGGERALDHEFEHRLAGGDQPSNRVVPSVQAKVTGVEPVGGNGHESLSGKPLLLGECSPGRLLARFVGVEGENDLTRTGRVPVLDIAHHPTDHLDVIDAKGGTTGRNGGGDARKMARHDIGVALNHDHLTSASNVLFCKIQAVEHLALVINGCLGSVEVFGTLIIVQ